MHALTSHLLQDIGFFFRQGVDIKSLSLYRVGYFIIFIWNWITLIASLLKILAQQAFKEEHCIVAGFFLLLENHCLDWLEYKRRM
jgi:hypothetical protein